MYSSPYYFDVDFVSFGLISLASYVKVRQYGW